MKKLLTGVMLFMLCLIGTTKVFYADIAVPPQLSPDGVSIIGILPVVIVIIIITWKIIQNMKKK